MGNFEGLDQLHPVVGVKTHHVIRVDCKPDMIKFVFHLSCNTFMSLKEVRVTIVTMAPKLTAEASETSVNLRMFESLPKRLVPRKTTTKASKDGVATSAACIRFFAKALVFQVCRSPLLSSPLHDSHWACARYTTKTRSIERRKPSRSKIKNQLQYKIATVTRNFKCLIWVNGLSQLQNT